MTGAGQVPTVCPQAWSAGRQPRRKSGRGEAESGQLVAERTVPQLPVRQAGDPGQRDDLPLQADRRRAERTHPLQVEDRRRRRHAQLFCLVQLRRPGLLAERPGPCRRPVEPDCGAGAMTPSSASRASACCNAPLLTPSSAGSGDGDVQPPLSKPGQVSPNPAAVPAPTSSQWQGEEGPTPRRHHPAGREGGPELREVPETRSHPASPRIYAGQEGCDGASSESSQMSRKISICAPTEFSRSASSS